MGRSALATPTPVPPPAYRLRQRINEIYHHHTNQSIDKIEDALERDYFMSADEAKAFGILDEVITKRSLAEHPVPHAS